MSDISFEAMKFGSENDLEIALTELKWIKSIHGKLTQDDFKTVAEKYEFPIDFLEKELSGPSYPEGRQMSKSKWYTVLYSWRMNERKASLDLYKLQFDYHKTMHRSTIFLGVLGVVLFQAASTLQWYLNLNLLETFSLIIIPFAFFFVSILIEFRNIIAGKKVKVEEYSMHLREKGFGEVVKRNERFIIRNYRLVVFAGGILLRKMQSAPLMDFFQEGFAEQMIQKRLSRINRLLVKLHIVRPKVTFEKETIPVFYGEDIDAVYRKRIKELEN
jgi:hypothetical protein